MQILSSMQIKEITIPRYERIVQGTDEAAGYHGIIFVHSTVLELAVGGTRFCKRMPVKTRHHQGCDYQSE